MDMNVLPIKDKTSTQKTIIKVIGVGGGGGNAVNYMYQQGVEHVSYLLCNTDQQHLDSCDVPHTICLGKETTKGLGAGNDPTLARAAALESKDEIVEALKDGTEMVFITAGMGGGTGTGAAPIIAGIAKEMGILTVGIVTIPFLFEGEYKILQAIDGVEELQKNVDAILVVKNELLKKIYPDFKISEAFKKADQTLTTSTRSISELVTIPGLINLDFNDVKSTLKDGGVSIITRGFASNEEGFEVAMERALNSPLLNTSNFDLATKVLIQVTYRPEHEPTTDVVEKLSNMTGQIKTDFNLIWGICERDDDSMEDDLGFTLLASGFDEKALGLDEYEEFKPAGRKPLTAQEEEEKKEKIKEYYGEDIKDRRGYKQYKTVIFTDELMNNNYFISLVNNRPTLERSTELLEELEQLAETSTQHGSPIIHQKKSEPIPTAEPNTASKTSGMIQFGNN